VEDTKEEKEEEEEVASFPYHNRNKHLRIALQEESKRDYADL
jgi:hypothetical protein